METIVTTFAVVNTHVLYTLMTHWIHGTVYVHAWSFHATHVRKQGEKGEEGEREAA